MVKRLKKGYDIALIGKPAEKIAGSIHSDTYCFKPTDFKGISRPKVLVNEGDIVKAGTPIFVDKRNEKAVFTSPVSGEVVAIIRGEKRVPLEIKILADKTTEYVVFPQQNPSSLSSEQIKNTLLESGVWINLLERPFGLVPNPENTPKNIFISCFDTSPLAPDYEFIFKDELKYLQAGIDALSKLFNPSQKGKVVLGTKEKSIFKNLKGVETHEFSGPHPAGNVGVQIHHTYPINKGEIVWTTTPYGLQQIGRLFLDGKYDARKVIALAGSEVKTPQYYEVTAQTCINKLVEGNIKPEKNVRYISGNVLTGEKLAKDGYLGYYANMITVIPEGNYYEFFGWIAPSANKISFSRALGLFSFLTPKKARVADTNMHGEERAFVQTGEFEKVVPMDILPAFLLKAIVANDYEGMEDLGIYEVLEEDFALCEFIDVSKIEVQSLLREGMNALMES
ncbi:MAG: Na(+)-translocating NADH-quinone reductase subunit A [Cytophagales bacterium]|nr:MAG: Na(+)-translocating NADH-quinone reductase subunit A [Cytophagales bacterium]